MAEQTLNRKRPMSDDQEVVFRKRRTGNEEIVILKLLIQAKVIGTIIGKGGETIKQLRQNHHVQLSVSKENYLGHSERVFMIKGKKENVYNAHRAVVDLTSEQSKTSHTDVKILVPQATAGMIIGKGGSTIKGFMRQSGADIQISKSSEMPERIVTVNGEQESVEKAFTLVYELIVEDPESRSCPSVDFNAPSGLPYGGGPHTQPPQHMSMDQQPIGRGRDSGMGRVDGGGYMERGMGTNHQSPAVENLSAMLRGSGYSNHAVEAISQAMSTLDIYGFLTEGANSHPTLTLENLRMFFASGRGTRPAPSFPSPGYRNFETSEVNTPRFSDGYTGGYGPTNSPQDGYGGGYAENMDTNIKFSNGNAKESVEMHVEDKLVGLILGPRGKDLYELKDTTGTNITISSKGEYVPGTTNRIVTITGTSQAANRAKYMIEQRIARDQAGRARFDRNA